MYGHKHEKMKLLLIALAVVILAGAAPVPVRAAAGGNGAENAVPAGRIVVSMGDSYSSGEGLGSYGKAEGTGKTEDRDWLSHRSDHAWPGQLTVPGIGVLGEKRDVQWYFTASSGAATGHFRSGQVIRFLRADKAGVRVLDPQLDVFSKIPEGKVSYVTLTVGGNDLGFVNILASCAVTPSSLFPDLLPEMLNDAWNRFENGTGGEGSIRQKIKEVCRDIAGAAGKDAVIIVAGYPAILNGNADNGFFEPYEAGLIDEYARKLDDAMKDLVAEFRSEEEGARICYVSVIDAFEGHEAYSADPYINGMIFEENDEILDHSPISAASFHPNEKGAAVYRELIQAAIDEYETLSPYYPGSGRIDTAAAYQALTGYVDTGYGTGGGKPVLFYDFGRRGGEYFYRLRTKDGRFENYCVSADTGEISEVPAAEDMRGVFGERRAAGNAGDYAGNDNGRDPDAYFGGAVMNYVRSKYDPAQYPDISGYLRYEAAADRYVCKLDLPEGGWRWVTLRADNGEIFDPGRNIFTLSGHAAYYLCEEGGIAPAAFPEEFFRGEEDGTAAGHCGVCRYDIDSDGTEKVFLYQPREEGGGTVYVYYPWGNGLVEAGQMAVPEASYGGLYIYKQGIITADLRTGALRYYKWKYRRLSEEKDWEGSGFKTIYEHMFFYGLHREEIGITPGFRPYTAAEGS